VLQFVTSFSNTNREALGLPLFQWARGGQGIVHCFSLVARNSGVRRGARINGFLSRFHSKLKLRRVELNNRGFE
jgi:hypothetical protein